MRVVLDTNILISALLFGGVPEEVYLRCVRGEPRLLVSEELSSELSMVLSRPRFGLTAEVVRVMAGDLMSVADMIETRTEVVAVPDDPSDNAVLACAVDGKADHVVSGDRHLLALGAYQGIPILTPREYLVTVLGAG